MPESEPRFTYVFAQELSERLRWFVRLRWLAVVGLASASLIGPRIGLEGAWPSLFVIAAVVAIYNAVYLVLNWRLRIEEERRHYHKTEKFANPEKTLQRAQAAKARLSNLINRQNKLIDRTKNPGADKSGAEYAVILGEEEVARREAGLKPLRTGEDQTSVALEDLAAALAEGLSSRRD